ncbi:MAG TPA: hypothetical protein VGH89_16410 [Pseudonocardia sp.]|jgi:hypothetical protein
MAVTGAALSASVLSPATAMASDLTGQLTEHLDNPNRHHNDGHTDHRHQGRHHKNARLRAPSSGEEQYRNGCQRGYITEDCGQFTVPSLLRRGINPYL